jgi:hypothetical protein
MITFTLILLASIFNGAMDINFNQYHKSIFSNRNRFNPKFWNPYESWPNKWKNGDKKQGEKFFLSSTWLVFLTDSWHLFKMGFLLAIFTSVVLYTPVINIYADLVIITIIWFIGFESTLSVLTSKKNK